MNDLLMLLFLACGVFSVYLLGIPAAIIYKLRKAKRMYQRDYLP